MFRRIHLLAYEVVSSIGAIKYIPEEHSRDMMKTTFSSDTVKAVDGLVAAVTESLKVNCKVSLLPKNS